MNIEEIQVYCLSKSHTSEDMPFDDSTLVFRVCGKIFALLSLEENLSINLKCDPIKAIDLREQFPSVTPGYHMNKTHWNTVMLDGSIERNIIFELIDHSYLQVVEKLTQKQRNELLKG